MANVLVEIVESKRAEVAALEPRRAAIEAAAAAAAPARDFLGALRGPTLGVIAEIKRMSPSKGALAPDLDPVATAQAYESGGASCLSVLTDGPYFGGGESDLVAARGAVGLPVLRKDFTIDRLQIDEARAMGADAVLLIVAALDDPTLADLHGHAVARGLTVLVEVHDDAELDRALALDPHLVGVNARDLASFAEDLSTGERMVDRIPAGTVAVAESAIRSIDDARRMAEAGFDAVLVGEALVRSDDPSRLVEAFRAVPTRPRTRA
ncbi:MAG: indole-3-glycerol phosphate synthase TrpC [Actinobacteria bacterium]|nr:indole-3-glycerol phosphate synthase TrpC [Actinomycetota bacterium]